MWFTHGLMLHRTYRARATARKLFKKNKKKRETPGIVFLKEIIMALARGAILPREFSETPATSGTTSGAKNGTMSGRGFFQRLFASMIVLRQRQADRQIANYLHTLGGKFTDEAERDIERLLTHSQVLVKGTMMTTFSVARSAKRDAARTSPASAASSC